MRKRRCFIRGQMHRLRRSRCKRSEIHDGFHFFYDIFSVELLYNLSFRPPLSRVEHCSPAKKHKATFPLSYFCMTKSTKIHQRERSPLFENSSRVHELVAGSSAWQVRAARGRAKVGGFALSAISYYHACEHSARRSRADSCTHCLHAR